MLHNKYKFFCTTVSDINEHLPTLHEYGLKVNHITECGVRGVISSYAFASALVGKENKLVQVDLDTNDYVVSFGKECKAEGVSVCFYQQSDLECPIEDTELLFIDTWHVYGQLKRELTRWNMYVSKYIILHDTTVDAIFGETIRQGMDAKSQSLASGIPISEILRGLWPAVEEFLESHTEWTLEKRYTNNNGLTILRRVNMI